MLRDKLTQLPSTRKPERRGAVFTGASESMAWGMGNRRCGAARPTDIGSERFDGESSEVTEEMIDAGMDLIWEIAPEAEEKRDALRRIYLAMSRGHTS